MTNYKFEGLDNDLEIRALGSLFRYHDASRWNINIQFSEKQPKEFLSISNAPVLARWRVLNATVERVKRGYIQEIHIPNTAGWHVGRIRDFPVQDFKTRTDAWQLCFLFPADDGKTVFLPQFELARALFFHDAYLSRTAIESDCLRTEFEVIRSSLDDTATINVMPSSGYPLSFFNDPGSRQFLSWILLDKDARRSYESICKYQRLDGTNRQNYRIWDFRFDPPPLDNCRLVCRGRYDPQTNCYFVCEVDGIRGLPANIPETIGLFHPKFAIPKRGTGAKAGANQNGQGGSFDVYDGVDSNANSQQIAIQSQPVEIVFAKAFSVSKVANREKATGHVAPGNDEGHQPNAVSTEEGVAGHGLPGASWNTLDDQTNNSHLFENKFSCFLDMVDVLINNHGCTFLSKKIRNLPKVGRCKKHLLTTDGNPRCIAVISLAIGEKVVWLLEVDTSDADKSLSTQVLAVRDLQAWDQGLQRLATELVQASLRWPRRVLAELCGEDGFTGVTHPQAPARNKGVLPPDSITGWAARVYGTICHL